MRKKKLPPKPGLPCIHVRIPKRGKEVCAEVVDANTKEVFWTKNYPKGTDLEVIMAEARLYKPVRKFMEREFNPIRFPVLPQKMVA
jgi:hypothetical protein